MIVWESTAIGLAAVQSSAVPCTVTPMSCPVFEITAAGSPSVQDDVYGFVNRTLVGDGVLVARIDELRGVSSSAAGLMIRGALDADAAQLLILRTPSGAVVVRRRAQANGAVTESRVPTLSGAAWMRLERHGQIVTVSQSVDGTQWTSSWSGTMNLPAAASLGLAVTSGRADAVTTAVASEVRLEAKVSLPAGWSAGRLGAASSLAQYQFAAPTWTISQWGTGIAMADDVALAYRRVAGDVEIKGRLLGATGTSTLVGLTVRASLSKNSPFFWLRSNQTGERSVVRRLSNKHTPATKDLGAGRLPGWLRLVRVGDLVTAYHSSDGLSWTELASASIDLPRSVYVGIALARGATSLAVAGLEDVAVSKVSDNPPPTVSLTAPSGGKKVAEGASLSITAKASDDDRVEDVEFLVDGRRVGIDTAAPYAATWKAAGVGSHVITAVARDSDGAVTRSAPVTVTVTRGSDGGGDGGDDAPPPPPPPPPPLSKGPWKLVFEPSADHDTLVDRYTAEIYTAERQLVLTRDLGRPAVKDGESTVDLTASIVTLPAGRYQLVMRAVNDATGARSEGATVHFDR